MSDFRTKVNIQQSKNKIDHQSEIMMIGSCFTDYIGQYLTDYKFKADNNPFGVLYNPLSVINSLQSLIHNTGFTEKELIFYNERWFSYSHHSDFSNPDKKKCLTAINKRIEYSSKTLKRADYLIITLGTARVFELKSTGEVVSNCHKVSATQFNRHLLSVKEIVTVFNSCIKELINFNKKIKIIFTVSPVRHWKDGANGNQISKAVLLLAINKLVEQLPMVEYFQSYEIIIDELRDYRFYKEDMLHPNNIAVKYIWERFLDTYFTKETRQLIKDIHQLVKAKQHKPFNASSESHKIFLAKHLQLTAKLQKQFPHLYLKEEDNYFSTISHSSTKTTRQ